MAAGNIGRPLVEAATEGIGVEGPSNMTPEVIVVEVSSFQLAWTTSFRPAVACWLNFAPDHLDWHHDLGEYARAKARIWRNQSESDAAVWNAEDDVVALAARRVASRSVPFGLNLGHGAFREADGRLLTSSGDLIVEMAELPRNLPHDRSNSLAAAASALEAGATVAGCRAALRSGVPMHHRIELVAERSGVAFYDDSKATTPSAVAAALAGFASVVLIAGGRNKGLDLGAIPAALVAEELAGSGRGTGRLRGWSPSERRRTRSWPPSRPSWRSSGHRPWTRRLPLRPASRRLVTPCCSLRVAPPSTGTGHMARGAKTSQEQ